MQLMLAVLVAVSASFLKRDTSVEVFTTAAPDVDYDDDSMLDDEVQREVIDSRRILQRDSMLYEQTTPKGQQMALVSRALNGTITKTSLFAEAQKAEQTMKWQDAVHELADKLPEDIVEMLQEGKESKGKPSFDEASLDKARDTLNGMIETAQEEYDLKFMECQGFKERNRGEFKQTVGDLSRLGSNIADDSALILSSKSDIQGALEMMMGQRKLRKANNRQCTMTKLQNKAQLNIIRADLKVARFIVQMTECKPGDSLLQNDVQACPLADGNSTLTFKNTTLAHEAQQIMSEEGRQALKTALFNSHAGLDQDEHDQLSQELEDGETKLAALLTRSRVHHRLLHDVDQKPAAKGEEAPPGVDKSMAPPGEEVVVTPPKTRRSKKKMGQKCVLGKADCGLLNDNMAQMWGDIKDAKDELQSIMADNQAHCKEVRDAHNAEISTYQSVMGQKNVELSEGTGSLNTNTEEQAESIQSKKELSKEYRKVWGECKEILHEILFTQICGTKTVRGEISKFSIAYGPTDILDCEVSDWVPEECSIECIDQVLCDGADPSKPLPHPSCAGGTQNMTRAVVQNLTLGAECPALILEKGCNNIPCPIDCEQTPWSPFSKCSKECGGGVQQRSRNTVTRPDNGGEACEDNSETQQCNVDSCDLDCVLTDWQAWGPCSRACSSGTQERVKNEISPKRAFGQCAHPEHADRFEAQTCNEFECPPAPICIAQQDVIIAVDVSGSLKKSGFATVQQFVNDLVSLYTLGEKNSAIGVLEYSKEGRIVSPLTQDSAELATSLAKLNFQRGITDMAVGFSLSKTILMEGRKEASSVVIMLTDAKPSFRFSTEKAAKELRKSGVRVVMVPIFKYGDTKFMKQLASDPPEDNVLTVGDLKSLAANSMAEAIGVMTATCALLEMPEEAPAGPEKQNFLSKIFHPAPQPPHHVRRVVYDREDFDDDDDLLKE